MNLNKPREYMYQEFEGFLHIRCECGITRTFCTQNPITHYICKCGKFMELGRENINKVTVKCECGKRSVYKTNVSSELVEIDCVNCGYPNVSQWSHKRQRYIPIRDRGSI